MKITKEKIDKDYYMDVSLNAAEIEALQFYRVVSKEITINRRKFTLSVRMDRQLSPGENDFYDFYEDF